jgi:hypothetical protein
VSICVAACGTGGYSTSGQQPGDNVVRGQPIFTTLAFTTPGRPSNIYIPGANVTTSSQAATMGSGNTIGESQGSGGQCVMAPGSAPTLCGPNASPVSKEELCRRATAFRKTTRRTAGGGAIGVGLATAAGASPIARGFTSAFIGIFAVTGEEAVESACN